MKKPYSVRTLDNTDHGYLKTLYAHQRTYMTSLRTAAIFGGLAVLSKNNYIPYIILGLVLLIIVSTGVFYKGQRDIIKTLRPHFTVYELKINNMICIGYGIFLVSFMLIIYQLGKWD